MSSYLNIYVKPREVDKKVLLWSFSRSSDMYQFFDEGNLSTYAYGNESNETRYKELDYHGFFSCLSDLKEEIYSDESRFRLAKDCVKSLDDVTELQSTREYIDEKIQLVHNLEMIGSMLETIQLGFSGIEGIFTNID